MALVDVAPEDKKQGRLSGIRLTSVNGAKHSKSWAELQPGRNRIEISFNWPQGGKQSVEFNFNAHKDRVYFVYLDRYPPCYRAHGSGWDDAFVNSMALGGEMGQGAPLALPFMAVTGLGSLAERGRMSVAEKLKDAMHVDVALVAPRTSQGTIEIIRAYPDGRTASR